MLEELSDLQRDALSETINIGVGRASRALSQFTKAEVAMSVPVVIRCSPEEVRGIVTPALFASPDVCSVSRRIVGMEAELAMIFQSTKEAMAELLSTSIVREGQDEIVDVREAVATKIGYLVIESCLDQMEHVVGRNIERFKLNYHPKLPSGIFSDTYDPKETVIIVKIDISVPKRNITGHLLCSLPRKGANRMADGLDALVIDSLTPK